MTNQFIVHEIESETGKSDRQFASPYWYDIIKSTEKQKHSNSNYFLIQQEMTNATNNDQEEDTCLDSDAFIKSITSP